MTTKAAFNADEWAVVTTAPVLTGLLVMAADKGGTVRESVAISRAYATAREQSPQGLLGEVLATPPTLDPRVSPKQPEELRREAPTELRRAIQVLDRLATDDDVVAYKRFVFALADTVARAHREGGFLGIGGKQVSEHEQEALDQIAAIFDEPPTIAHDGPSATA